MNQIKVTSAQYARMDKHIADLQRQLQSALAERDRAKMSDGDRSENSALDAAEREVSAIQAQLDDAQRDYHMAIVVNTIDTSIADVLTQVELQDPNGIKRVVSLVDSGQGYPPSHVSIDSKMGSALKGHRVGDQITYQDNRFRTRTFLITRIQEDQ